MLFAVFFFISDNLTAISCIFFWKGKEEIEQRVHGVGFAIIAIKNELVKNLEELPAAGVSERLMTPCIKLKSGSKSSNHSGDRNAPIANSRIAACNDTCTGNRHHRQLNTSSQRSKRRNPRQSEYIIRTKINKLLFQTAMKSIFNNYSPKAKQILANIYRAEGERIQ